MPKPRSTKLSPFRTPRPMPSYGIHPPLEDEVLHEPTDRVIRERRDQARIETESTLEPPGHVVLAAAFRNPEVARRRDPAIAWIETEHDFTERHEVEPTMGLGLDGQFH
jgi:hypothetical protein